MHYFIDDTDTLVSLDTTGTVCRYTATGWVPEGDMTPLALAGLGWQPISANEAVRIQREITFGRRRPAG